LPAMVEFRIGNLASAEAGKMPALQGWRSLAGKMPALQTLSAHVFVPRAGKMPALQ
jgi:hypothetical protein